MYAYVLFENLTQDLCIFEMYWHFFSVIIFHLWVYLNVLYYQVLRNKPDFRRKPWPSISNSAKDFVKKLLVKDPRARLTAAQALCMCIIYIQ